MNYVHQEDSMGCGIACVAFLTNKDYKDAVNLFSASEKRSSKGFTSKDIREALKKGGLIYKSVYVGRDLVPKIEIGNIVYVTKCKYFPYGHYLVKINEGYMDPLINLHEVNFDYKKARAGLRGMLPGRVSLKIVLVE